ncbi:hypothetical protein ALTERO38_50494 [Alteromonas sp. 38]|nr:hypothetical protein ALTER154_80775 [Alteromonas sp. 154]VXB35225.1 hypothetical protein ALTERO38_50494 [Alteromonas sp. 38]
MHLPCQVHSLNVSNLRIIVRPNDAAIPLKVKLVSQNAHRFTTNRLVFVSFEWLKR